MKVFREGRLRESIFTTMIDLLKPMNKSITEFYTKFLFNYNYNYIYLITLLFNLRHNHWCVGFLALNCSVYSNLLRD